ncbi:hypothetical protein WH47_02817 [Habropoda laboriosa]|uniref:Uncharacterized protein n=1 Tax=Habropoda laboriosa TaxID=597456 RepID=A0A0L7RHL7_9HYME|nr:hypothetical protein WH47_02817 [Habropoda laboriosa]
MAQEIPETTYVPEVEEDARKERERRSVQEGTVLWRRRKEELRRQKHREQRELQQILENYSPWGKPGGGAPCAATLRKKNVPLEPPEPPKCHNFGQLAPLWPWGRPGPGGVPWRDPKLLGVRFLESMVRIPFDTFIDLRSDQDESKMRIRMNPKFEVIARFALRKLHRLQQVLPHFESFQGWTSNSTIERLHNRGITPLADTDMNKFLDDKAEQGIVTDVQLVEDTKNRYNEEIQVYELTGGVELVPLLTSRRYYSQPPGTRHVTTDATRPGYTIESLRTLGVGNREYITELTDQVRRKREKALEERRMEQESCRRHFDTWRKLWGKPGHGAPIDHAHRNNLYNILYRPAIY